MYTAKLVNIGSALDQSYAAVVLVADLSACFLRRHWTDVSNRLHGVTS
jgi:hypothetical protein